MVSSEEGTMETTIFYVFKTHFSYKMVNVMNEAQKDKGLAQYQSSRVIASLRILLTVSMYSGS